jgi:hypothetical protein
MESPWDIAVAVIAVTAAGVLAWRRMRAPGPPACGTDVDAKPSVIVGSSLSKAMKHAKRS